MKHNDEDLILLSGEFKCPQNKEWLTRYFRSDLTKTFVDYYTTFRGLLNRVSLRYYGQLFTDHTGMQCDVSVTCAIAKKVRDLEDALQKAEEARDLELIATIKSGKYNI